MQTLKEATHAKHKEAEKMLFNIKMFKGQLTPEQYLAHLNQQLAIFQTIESKGLPDKSLTRVAATQDDIDELIAQGHKESEVLQSTKEYTNYLNTLTRETILPHIYLNYLAIMFGGQIMKRKVPSTGKMYDFEDKSKAMKTVRDVQKDEWANEVNKAYENIINIFKELETKLV